MRVVVRICLAVVVMGPAISLPSQTIRDSAGIRIVENSSALWRDAERLQLSAQPMLTLRNDVDSMYRFRRVRGVFRFEDGSLLVADGGSLQLRRYGAQGEFMSVGAGKAVARGQVAPGQLTEMSGVFRLPGDTIAVTSSLSNYSLYTRTGQFVRAQSFPFDPMAGPAILVSMLGGGLRVATSMGAPKPRAPGTQWVDSLPFKIANDANVVVHELGMLPYVQLLQKDTTFTPPWLSPVGVFVAGNHRFYAGYGDRYAVRVFASNGKLETIIRRAWTPAPITPDDWEEWVVEWSKLWVKDTGAARDAAVQEVRDAPYAFELPAFSQFLVDHSGRLWVRAARWQDAIAAGSLSDRPAVPSTWSVFDARGAWLGDVTMPARFQPYDIGSDYVAGSMSESGVIHVVVYSLAARGR